MIVAYMVNTYIIAGAEVREEDRGQEAEEG